MSDLSGGAAAFVRVGRGVGGFSRALFKGLDKSDLGGFGYASGRGGLCTVLYGSM